jgi:hypothetical protein
MRCPRCATPNDPSRAFCRSCGETLVPEPGPVATGRNHESGPRIGAPYVAAAAVVAIAVVLFVIVRPGFGPSASPGASLPVLASLARMTPSPAVAPTPTLLQEPVRLAIGSAEASSFALGRPRYAPANAIDGKLDTSWQEGAPTEAGQWIEISVERATLDRLVVFNGWQWTDDSYFANLRLREIQVLVDDAEAAAVTLEDRTGGQEVALHGAVGSRVRIVIASTYDSESRPEFSPDSPFDDAAISEIELYGQGS